MTILKDPDFYKGFFHGVLIGILFLLLMAICKSAHSQCPVKGSNPSAKFQHLDSLKNRSAKGHNIQQVDVSDFLNDAIEPNENKYVAMTGYVVGCKWGGKESCECHSPLQKDFDIHIEIAGNPGEIDKTKMMVVEMTRYTRNGTVLADIKKMIGKKVLVTGWVFSDIEHKQNSEDENPDGTDLWRGTDVEIHPVFKIELQ